MMSQLKGCRVHCWVPTALCGLNALSDAASIIFGILANGTPRYQDEKGCLYGSNLTCHNKCPTPSLIFHWALQRSYEEVSVNLGIGLVKWNLQGHRLQMSPDAFPVSTHAPIGRISHTLGECFPLTAPSSFSSWNGGGQSHRPRRLSPDLSVHVCSLVKLVSERGNKESLKWGL